MNTLIVQSKEIVTLIGGGSLSRSLLETVISDSATIVAADGGARHALEAGHMPDAVIGDFDSLDSSTRSRIPEDRLHHVGEQDSTDFEKCLARIAAPLVQAVGFMGPRIDHQLAVFHGLLSWPGQPCLLISETQLAFLCPPQLQLSTEPGQLVSAFPLRPVAALSSGLRWPLDGLDLAPGAMIGTSNVAEGAQITLSCDMPGLLIILPRSARAQAASALLKASGRWPARAG